MNRRKLSFILAAIMLVNMVLGMAMPVYADVDERIAMMEAREMRAEEIEGVIGEGLSDPEASDPQDDLEATDGEDAEAADENADEADGLQGATSSVVISEDGEYYLTMTAEAEDGTIVMVEADKDVFPEGVTLEANVADDETAEAAAEQIEEEATASESEAVERTTYDIRVMLDGQEVEPDTTKGRVNISFVIPEAPATADTATIYHHTEDGLEVIVDDAPLATSGEIVEEIVEKVENAAEVSITDGVPSYLLKDALLTNDVNDEVTDISEDEIFETDEDEENKEVEESTTVAETAEDGSVTETYELNGGGFVEVVESKVDKEETLDDPVVLSASVESFSSYTVEFRWNAGNAYSTKIYLSLPVGKVTTLLDIMKMTHNEVKDGTKLYPRQTPTIVNESGTAESGYIELTEIALKNPDGSAVIDPGNKKQAYDYQIKFLKEPDKTLRIKFVAGGTNKEILIKPIKWENTPGTVTSGGKTYTAKIRGFAAGDTGYLRVSELLEVYTEGYDADDVLTYKYEMSNTPTTPTWIVDIFNTSDMRSTEAATTVRTTNTSTKFIQCKYFAAQATGQDSAICSTLKIKVTVRSSKGIPDNVCYYNYLYSASLKTDCEDGGIILYEGETSTEAIRGLYSLSGVTHIKCAEAHTSNLEVEGGGLSNEHISAAATTVTIGKKQVDDFILTGKKEGTTYFTMTVGKTTTCDHHKGQEVEGVKTMVKVIKKPIFINIGGGQVKVINTTEGVDYTISGITKESDGSTPLIFPHSDSTCILRDELDGYHFIRTETYVFTELTKVTVTGITAANKVYDGNTSATLDLSGAKFDGKSKENLGVTATGTFGNADAGDGKTVTLSGMALTGSAAILYEIDTDKSQKTATASISKKEVKVEGIKANNKTYDGNTSATLDCSGATFDGAKITNLGVTATGTFADASVGDGKTVNLTNRTLTGAAAGNYSIKSDSQETATANITKKEVKIEGITANDKPYDGNKSATLDYSGAKFNGGTIANLGVLASGSFVDEKVGHHTVNLTNLTLTGTAASSYTIKNDSQTTTEADITQKPVVVKGIGAYDKKYDGNSNVSFKYDDVTFDGNKIANLSVTSTGYFCNKEVGVNKPVSITSITLTGSAASNYKLADSGNQTVTYATISYNLVNPDEIHIASKSYTGSTQMADAPKVTGCTCKTNPGGTDVGLYPVGYELKEGYAWTDGTRGTLTKLFEIMPKEVTVDGITANNKVYDGTTAATLVYYGMIITGRCGSDDLSATATGSFIDKKVDNGKTVNISDITLTGTKAFNYKLAETGNQTYTTANITKKTLKVLSGVSAEDKTYDATLAATVSTAGIVFEGLCPGDSIGVDADGQFSDKNVASAPKTVTLTKFELTGTDKDNYDVDSSSVGTLTAKINPAEVSVSGIEVYNKTYDGTTKATVSNVGVLTGKLGSDNLTHKITDQYFEDKNAGTGKTVYLTVELDGTDKNNYKLSASSQKTTTADISKRTITNGVVSGVNAEDKPYDGNVLATLSTTSEAKLYDPATGEYIPVLAAEGEFLTPEAGNLKDVKITELVLGDGKDNYDIDYDSLNKLKANITKAVVTKPAGQYTYYNTKEQTSTFSETGLYSVTQAKGTDVGNYYATLTLKDPTNYRWPESETSVTSNVIFEIRKALTVEIEGPVLPDWNYKASPSEPQATPSNALKEEIEYWYEGTLRNGEHYGPKKATPTEAGTYEIIAKIPETPNHPAAEKRSPFTIWPIIVDEPVVASKSYTGYHQIGDITGTEEYDIVENYGGIPAAIYPVIPQLKDANNYQWSKLAFTPVMATTSVPFEITKATAVEIEGPVIEDWFYGASPSEPQATPTNAYKEEIEYWYEGTLRNGTPYGPTQTTPSAAGAYKVTASISETPDHPAKKKSTPFTIWPKVVNEPTVASKSYTGYRQIADIEDTLRYTIKQNFGGIDAGTYPVIPELRDPNNYRWSKFGFAPVIATTSVPFEITKATKVEIEGPVIEDWTYGASPSEPYATPTNAPKEDMEYWYEGTLRDGTPYGPTQTTPSDAGTYNVIASISETPNHPAAKKSTPFTIWPKVVEEPTAASKSYTGYTQKADVADTAEYTITKNDGGINADIYPVDAKLKDKNNYRWSKFGFTPVIATTSVPFEITKATSVEIEGPEIEDWTYGASPSEPQATPTNAYKEEIEYWYEGTLRDGRHYGPTQTTPSEAGTYEVIASISETPNHAAKQKRSPFTIWPIIVDEPVVASKSYTGFHQIGDVDGTEEYYIFQNFGGIRAAIYPVIPQLYDANNYRWSKLGFTPVMATTSVPFEITKATIVEIEGPVIEDWNYGATPSEPQATPTNAYKEEIEYWYEGTLRNGTPYGPTQTTPSDAGSYEVIASISETPDHSAAEKRTPFKILPLPVQEPVVASKSYTGYNLKGDIYETPRYRVAQNDGGIDAAIYPVIPELKDSNNYRWSKFGFAPVIATTSVPFEITKATSVEIEGPEIEDWTYGASPSEPYATPTNAYKEEIEYWYEGTLRDGRHYGPTQTTPSEAGSYEVTASISETPNHPAKKKSTPFTIWPKVVEEPTAASKSYTGYTQIADVADTAEYTITKNDGGINADIYPVDAKLKDKNNYRWSKFGFTPVIATTSVPFEITKATIVEIEGPVLPDWNYKASPSEPQATPTNAYKEEIEYWYEGTLRDGTPYGPTQTTPSEAGTYEVIASISETPNHPAAEKRSPFTIWPIIVDEPVVASKSYTGYHQIGDVDGTEEYDIIENSGGIPAAIYPVIPQLKDANNYRWSKLGFTPVMATTSVPFEITKATKVEIEGPTLPSWDYGATPSEPQATPTNAYKEEIEYWYEGILRDGTPYGPTQTTPSNAGSYFVIASISETPDHPAASKSTAFYIYPLMVKDPTVASKSYTGYNQIADIAATDKYDVAQNNGGIHAGIYDVILSLWYPNNYYWSSKGKSSVVQNTTVPFEILKATDNEIPQNDLEEGFKDWIYWASPSVVASPSVSPQYGTPSSLAVTPKYGTPSYTFYKEQPDGTWKKLATLSEEGPYLTATPTEVGHYKVVINVPGTDDWEEITREWDFWIYPALIQLPTAPDKVYNGNRQIAWLYEATPSEEYSILQNDGGIEVGSYPVVLEAGPNYVWDLGTATASVATISFAIIPDPINPKTPEEKAKGEEYNSGNSTIRVHSNIEEGAPLTYIDNLNLELAYSLLTPEEKAEYDAGTGIHIEVVLNVKEQEEGNVGATDSQIVHSIADQNSAKLGEYLDLTLDKIVTNSTGHLLDGTTRITDTAPKQLRIVVRVPEELRKQRRTYYIARVHEYPAPVGIQGDLISTTIIEDSWIDIAFMTDKFSTYAILYKDPASPTGGGGGAPYEIKWWNSTDSGWVKKPGTEDWYVIQNDSLVKGWFHDNEDAFWYYLDPSSGIMKSGWQDIGGKQYYFTPIDQVPQGTWFYNQTGDGKWHYYGDRSFHTYGSMYCNEQTPDGYWVDETGALIDADGKWWSADEADAGWVRKNGTTDWYYIKNNTLKRGWHDDQEDGHRYYLDPLTGIMFKNWNRIGSYMYYFTTDADAPQQTWFKDASSDGKWHYYGDGNVLHPLGSMYSNETTPDGHTVNASGVRID